MKKLGQGSDGTTYRLCEINGLGSAKRFVLKVIRNKFKSKRELENVDMIMRKPAASGCDPIKAVVVMVPLPAFQRPPRLGEKPRPPPPPRRRWR